MAMEPYCKKHFQKKNLLKKIIIINNNNFFAKTHLKSYSDTFRCRLVAWPCMSLWTKKRNWLASERGLKIGSDPGNIWGF